MRSKKIKNYIVDLETGSQGVDAAIFSIGAAHFTSDGIEDTFYKVVDLKTSLKEGFKVDARTIEWWLKQQDDTLFEITQQDRIPIRDALKKFSEWIEREEWVEKEEKIQIWGNGSDFDNSILRNAYQKCSMHVPWRYYENRCYRTILSSLVLDPIYFEKNEEDEFRTPHHALEDAIYEASKFVEIINNYELEYILDDERVLRKEYYEG